MSILLNLGMCSVNHLEFNIYYMIFSNILLTYPLLFADPERPKNDKATILTDTLQLLKELTSEVNKLKSEYTALTDESREVHILINYSPIYIYRYVLVFCLL